MASVSHMTRDTAIRVTSYLLLFLLCSLSFYLFKFSEEFRRLVFLVIAKRHCKSSESSREAAVKQYLSSSLLSLPPLSESASMSLVSSKTRRRLASRSSSASPPWPGPASRCLLTGVTDSALMVAAVLDGFFFEKCAASASRSCALRSLT